MGYYKSFVNVLLKNQLPLRFHTHQTYILGSEFVFEFFIFPDIYIRHYIYKGNKEDKINKGEHRSKKADPPQQPETLKWMVKISIQESAANALRNTWKNLRQSWLLNQYWRKHPKRIESLVRARVIPGSSG